MREVEWKNEVKTKIDINILAVKEELIPLIFKWVTWVSNHYSILISFKITMEGFPGGAVVKNPPANAGDTGSSPGLGSSHLPRSN